MGNVIATNVPSINAQRNLLGVNNNLQTTFQRLSSGFRINSAKDDAAGLQISNRLTTQIGGLTVAVRNANDGISLSQTAEGALQESTNILQRIRDLAIQAANGSNGPSERRALQEEVSQLQQELNRIADTTSFGGRKILDGTFGSQSFQVGANAFETISVALGSFRADAIGNYTRTLTGTASGAGLGTVNTGSSFANAANDVAGSLQLTGYAGSSQNFSVAGASAKGIADDVNDASGSTGITADARTVARINSFSAAGTVTFSLFGSNTSAVAINANLTSTTDFTDLAKAINDQSAQTGISATVDSTGLILTNENGDDIGIADYTNSATTGNETLSISTMNYEGDTVQYGAYTVTEGGATDSARVTGVVKLNSQRSFTSTASDVSVDVAGTGLSTLAQVDQINISTQIGAQKALSIVDSALASIDSSRASLGAVQNRLSSTISNLNSIVENVSASRSRVRDTDFAAETANLSKNQVLQQAGLAILAQANQSSQSVLSLLQG
ncbi:MAG: flagellin [Gammaproteobacteria bacterium]|nr:flagellin [Gammaproteobacteria bacterium]